MSAGTNPRTDFPPASPMAAEELDRLVRQSEQQARVFDTVLSSILDFAYSFSRDGRFLYSNRALLDLLGVTLEEITGKNFFDLNYPHELATRLQRQIEQVFTTGEIVKDETPFVSPTGVSGFYEYIFSPVFGDNGAVEVVAGSTRNITERKQTEQRERQIASQLQAALQPCAPPDLPGLKLNGFYRPAIEEAGVGGDFYDVFTIDGDRTALVVGDLSGKGLTAASEVATVRNMVRYALYSGRAVAEAIEDLNRILVDHGLLAGFTTLFAGIYDHSQRLLTYANCGQEPGLVWQAATRTTIELDPTGPVLGGFIEGTYTQQTIGLAPGDVLVLFTDGMTEVGSDRKVLLGVEGVSRLLDESASRVDTRCAGDPKAIADYLIAAVDAFGQGGVRDDIALLVGIVTGDRPIER